MEKINTDYKLRTWKIKLSFFKMQKIWHGGGALAYWTWPKSGLYTSVSSRTLKELLVRSFKLFPKISEFLSLFPHLEHLEHLDESLGLSLHRNGFLTTLFLCVLGHLAFTDWLGPRRLASSTLNSLFVSFFKDDFFWSSFVLTFHLILSYFIDQHNHPIKLLHCFLHFAFFMMFSSKRNLSLIYMGFSSSVIGHDGWIFAKFLCIYIYIYIYIYLTVFPRTYLENLACHL